MSEDGDVALDFDEDLEMLKYEYELGQIDKAEYQRQLAARKKVSNQAPAGKKGRKPSDDIDVDALLAAMDKNGGELPDSDDEKHKPQPVKAAPKPTVTTHQKPSAPAPQPTPQKVSAPAPVQNKPSAVQDQGGYAEEDDDTLFEEEDKYHNHQQIVSLTAMNYEIENYFPKVLDEQTIGEDTYRDCIDGVRDEWQLFIEKVSGQMQAGRLTPDKYCEMVKIGLDSQKRLLEEAKKNKTTLNTINRIKKRISVIEGEIAELSKSDEEPAEPTNTQHIEPPKQAENVSAPVKAETQSTQKPKVEESHMKEEKVSKPSVTKTSMEKEYLIPKEKLDALSDRINQYIYLALYWQENQIAPKNGILIKVAEAKKLFVDPYTINATKYNKCMQDLPEIELELLLGTTPEERDAKIDLTLQEAEESFELMKVAQCTKEEATSTADVIKYLRKLKDIKTVPFPEIKTSNLEKVNPAKSNQSIPDDTVKLTFLRLSGAADHRVFFIRYFFEYGGKSSSGDTPYV